MPWAPLGSTSRAIRSTMAIHLSRASAQIPAPAAPIQLQALPAAWDLPIFGAPAVQPLEIQTGRTRPAC